MKNINDYLLTKDVTVGELRKWMEDKDDSSKGKIINLIHHRFYKRYIKHLENTKSGFLIMAVSCLNIETLESFKRGIIINTIDGRKVKKDSKGKKVNDFEIFDSFFLTEDKNFKEFKDISSDFFENVRCGILHQGETGNAWRIILNEKLIDKTKKVIGAKKFLTALENSLNDYIENLESKSFNDILWKNALIKLDDICNNCNTK